MHICDLNCRMPLRGNAINAYQKLKSFSNVMFILKFSNVIFAHYIKKKFY